MTKLLFLLLMSICLATPLLAADLSEALLIGETCYVPLRPLGDWLGAERKFDYATQTVTLTAPGILIKVTIGSDKMTFNNAMVSFPQPAIKHGSNIYVPAREMIAALHGTMMTDGTTRRIMLQRDNVHDDLTFRAVWVNPIDGEEMVWVPAGECIVGGSGTTVGNHHRNAPIAQPNEPRASVDVTPYATMPAHTVKLDGYWIGKYEVTVAEYQKFCAAMKHPMPPVPIVGYQTRGKKIPWDAAAIFGKNFVLSGISVDAMKKSLRRGAPVRAWRADHPIVLVSWEDAMAYADWVHGRLPTECEWEKTARGLDGRAFPWGERYDGNKLNVSREPADRDRSMIVGSFPDGTSPYGAMDMAGNAAEWCLDWLDPRDYGKYDNPCGISDDRHAIRGGSWAPNGSTYEMTCRWQRDRKARMMDVGFRLVVPDTTNSRAAVAVTPAHQMIKWLQPLFPAGYNIAEVWEADLNGDGQPEAVAIATGGAGGKLPPLLKVFQFTADAQNKIVLLDDYTFNEPAADGGFRWTHIVGENGRAAPLQPEYFGIRDLNADGKPEIYLLLRSGEMTDRTYDDMMAILSLNHDNKLQLLANIPFPRADRGMWMVDAVSDAHQGLQVLTIGQYADPKDAVIKPRPFQITYYGWNGATFEKYRSKVTRDAYATADEMLKHEAP